MGARKKVWDIGRDDGPVEMDMWAVDADEAVKNDPERYTFTPPEGSAGAMEIPNDWADMPNSKRRGLALKLGAPNTIKVTEVNAYIEGVIEERAASQTAPSA